MRWVVGITIAAVLGAASMSPALAAKHAKPAGAMSGACAQQGGRCISDRDQLNWCTMYICANGQSTPIPFWRCLQPSGLCLASHC